MMSFIRALTVIVAVAGVLAGCSSTSGLGGSQGGAGGYEFDTRQGAESFGYQDGTGPTGQPLGTGGIGPSRDTTGRVIYFDFDSAEIRQESRPVIEAHASYLVQNPAVGVQLEGHTDQRGTREYNIALGERRGQAVRDLMIALGAGAQQIGVVSFGEEQLTGDGQGEGAMAQDRRVELAY